MKDLKSRLAEKFNDKNFEKKYNRTSALYRLADEILLLRKQRGLTQQELAQKVGTTQTVISRLESATVKPSLETILKIAEALDAALDIRLLPVEKIRRKSVSEDSEVKNQDSVKGILYFNFEQDKISANEKWISPQNAPIDQVIVKTSSHTVSSKKRKVREYA